MCIGIFECVDQVYPLCWMPLWQNRTSLVPIGQGRDSKVDVLFFVVDWVELGITRPLNLSEYYAYLQVGVSRVAL